MKLSVSPYGSPVPLVVREQVSSRNSKEFPRAGPRKGALNEGGVDKIGDFRPLSRHISETMQDMKDMTKVVINVYTRFRLVPKSITLDDRERINGRFRMTVSSEMAIFSLFAQKYVAKQFLTV